MTGQMRRSGVFAVAAALVVAACAGDTGEQEAPADTAPSAEPAPTTPPATPATDVQLPEGVTQAMVTEGEQIFNRQICFSCHGTNGVGGPLAPNLTDATWINTDGTLEGIMNVVREGVAVPKEHAAAMPPMGGLSLTDDQVRAVSAYVYSLGGGQ